MSSVQLHVCLPQSAPPNEYFDCRYEVLREPLGFGRESRVLPDDDQAIHAWMGCEGDVLAVGRAHLIPNESDGSCADHSGPDSTRCPPFHSLEAPQNRPAVQIRQMGTRDAARRKGYAKSVLVALEDAAQETFSAAFAVLQARVDSIPFYEACGWELVDGLYQIDCIGMHQSMVKRLEK